jgi:glycosyltransferase involved in cell wall biosynthesis
MKISEMRVALVSGGLPFGGTTTFCMFLATGLKELGVPVEVFSFTCEHPLAPEFSELDIPVHIEDQRRRIFEDRMAGIYAELKKFQPTAVFAVLGSEAFELFRYLPKDVFRVAMVHDHFQPIYDMLQNYRAFYDEIVVVAKNIEAHVKEILPGTPCTYLQHGIFLNGADRVRRANPNQPLKIIFFGRLDQASKGVRIFPEIWRELKMLQFPFQWTIHGTGPDEGFLRAHLAEAEKNGEVIFSKPVVHKELGNIIRAHDVYLLTSIHEAGPLTLLEAMGYGLVPVCGDIPCLLQEVITPENGFRVPPKDVASYVAAIAKFNRDRELLEKMSKRARATVETGFTEEAMARRYVDYLQAIPKVPFIPWPDRIAVKPMLQMEKSIFFHPAFRVLRRIAKRLAP